MDDDLSQFDSLTDDIVGEQLGNDTGSSERHTAAPSSQTQRRSWPARLKRGLSILVRGRYNGIRFHWRDRATILTNVLAVFFSVAAALAVVMNTLGIQQGFIWELRVAARSMILAGFELAGETGLFLLNTPWVSLLLAVLMLILVRRGVN